MSANTNTNATNIPATNSKPRSNPFLPQKRTMTRSQVPTLDFAVSLERSPLKEARNAIRRANIVLRREPEGETSETTEPSRASDDNVGEDGGSSKDILLEQGVSVIGRVGEQDEGLDEERVQEISMCVDTEPTRDDEILLSPRKDKTCRVQSLDESSSATNPNSASNPSATGEKTIVLSPSMSQTSQKRLGDDTPSIQQGPAKKKKVEHRAEPGKKEAKGTLPMFFARQAAKQKGKQKQEVEGVTIAIEEQSVRGVERTVTDDADDGEPSCSTTVRPQPTTPRRAVSDNLSVRTSPPCLATTDFEEPHSLLVFTTPAKSLRNVPHLDLKLCTPSPRKVAGLGLGNAPSVMSAVKAKSTPRAISEGMGLRMGLSHFEGVDTAQRGSSQEGNHSTGGPSTMKGVFRAEGKAIAGMKTAKDHATCQDLVSVRESPIDSQGATIEENPHADPVYLEHRPPQTPTRLESTLQSHLPPLTPLTPLNALSTHGKTGEDEHDTEDAQLTSCLDVIATSSHSTSSSLTEQSSSQSSITGSSDNKKPKESDCNDAPFPRKSLLPRPSMYFPKTPSSSATAKLFKSPLLKTPFHRPQTSNSPIVLKSTSKPTVSPKLRAPVTGTKPGTGVIRTTGMKRKLRTFANLATPKMTRSAALRVKQAQQSRSALVQSQPVTMKMGISITSAQTGGSISRPSASKGTGIIRSDKAGKITSVTGINAVKPAGPVLRRASTCPPDSPTHPKPDRSTSAEKVDNNDEGSNSVQTNVQHGRKLLSSPLVRSRTEINIGDRERGRSSPQDETKARSQSTLNTLNDALAKLALPPPSRPVSRLDNKSDDEIVPSRPATSLGFNSERNVPLERRLANSKSISRVTGSGNSVNSSSGPKQRTHFPPPPRFQFGDKGKNSATNQYKFGFAAGLGSKASTGCTSSAIKKPMFPNGVGTGIFARPAPRMRASQRTSLETVVGSPVKPSTTKEDVAERGDVKGKGRSLFEEGMSLGDGNDEMDISTLTVESLLGGSTSGKGMTETDARAASQIRKDSDSATTASRRALASRRASIAFSSLSQSLNESLVASPVNASNSESSGNSPVSNVTGKYVTKTSTPTLQQSSFGRTIRPPSRVGVTQSSSDPMDVPDNVDNEPAMHSKKAKGAPVGALGILKSCVVFVDVRTEEGEDAGDLFVDMLKGLGAKVLTRVGQTCTHIVYKNGLASTLTRYRLLDDPRPVVVGIGWVVECAEKRVRVDEERFKVDVASMNAASLNKSQNRRRSMMPKQTVTSVSGPMDAFVSGRAEPLYLADDASFDSPNDIADGSGEGAFASLAPLEKARQRKHTKR